MLAAVGAVASVRVVGARGEAEDALEEVGLALEAEALRAQAAKDRDEIAALARRVTELEALLATEKEQFLNLTKAHNELALAAAAAKACPRQCVARRQRCSHLERWGRAGCARSA